MNNNTTLTEAIKALYTANTNISVKDLLGEISSQYSHLKDKAHYRAVYNTLKRISKGSLKTQVVKAPKTEKSSIILDFTQEPLETVSSKVFFAGKA